MPAVTLVMGASAVAMTSSSLTVLFLMPEHDLARALGVIGVIAGGLAAIFMLVEIRTRHLGGMNNTLARVARNEYDVLTALRNGNPLDTGERRRRN